MKKNYLSYLILATILILVSCTGSITTTDTDTKILNGACNFKLYDTSNNGAEQASVDGTCKDGGTILTIDFPPTAVGPSGKKGKKIVIDSTTKTLTITFEDNTTNKLDSTSGAGAVTVTAKTDYWEVYIDGKLNTKVTAK